MEGNVVVEITCPQHRHRAALTKPQIGEVREFIQYHVPRGTVLECPVDRGDEILDFETTMGKLLDSLGGAE